MPARGLEPPPELRCHQGIDGLEVILAARGELLGRLPRRILRWCLPPLLLALAAFGSSGDVLGQISLVLAAGTLWWTLRRPIHPPFSRVEHQVRLGPRTLLFQGSDGPVEVPWNQVGRTEVLGGVAPVVRIHRAPDGPLDVRMEHEPQLHAHWLAQSVARVARARRDEAGSRADVPDALQSSRTAASYERA